MGMDAYDGHNFVLEPFQNGENNGVEEDGKLTETLARLDIDLSYSFEKMENLDVYMAIVSLGETQLGEMSMDIEIEKALMFDLSLGYLESEVTELKHFLNVCRAEMIVLRKELLSLGRRNREGFTVFEGKLHDSECSLKHFQEQMSELQRRLAIMRGIPYGQKNTAFLYDEDATSEMSGSDFPTSDHQRLVLRMLDKSLSGELDLENQLLDSKEREEDLKSRLSVTNVLVSDLELFGEFALEKLLEAEHCSEVYMGIAKDMMSRLQILQFNMHCSVQRESDLKSKLQSSLTDTNQLERKVKELENKLHETLEEVSSMENTVTSLTEDNIELRDELAFLKDGDDNLEKISLLEKQSRNLEVQLQNANKSSEASNEQQNMLYTAIWDMETLIEELRSKVSRAEIRADNSENQCLSLAETNIKLSKEICNIRSDSKKLQERLQEADEVKLLHAKDVNTGAKLVSEVVIKLASERERIQKQHSALAKENKVLLEELRKLRKTRLKANHDNVHGHETGVSVAVLTVQEIVETPTCTTGASNLQVDDPDSAIAAETVTSERTVNMEISRPSRHSNKKYYSYIFAAVVVLSLSILAMHMNWEQIPKKNQS